MRPRSASLLTHASSAGSQPPSSRLSIGLRWALSFLRCTRASGCRCSKRWRVAFPSRARTERHCPKSQVRQRCSSIPEQPAAISEAIETLLSDVAVRDRLIRAGLERAGLFTWAATARATIDTYLA